MDANLSKLINMRISKTIDNLKKNNINALYVPSKETALAFLKSILVNGESIAVGGSVTLDEIGALPLLRSGQYAFIDRYDKSATKEEIEERKRAGLLADTFITGTNAITESGCLYNVDGTGNRAAAFVYGPKRVIVLVGYNKIVPNLADAVVRVKRTACPANTIRLDSNTYCEKNGHCIKDVCDARNFMTLPAGLCKESICCSAVISAYQRNKDRITVIIIGEELGY